MRAHFFREPIESVKMKHFQVFLVIVPTIGRWVVGMMEAGSKAGQRDPEGRGGKER